MSTDPKVAELWESDVLWWWHLPFLTVHFIWSYSTLGWNPKVKLQCSGCIFVRPDSLPISQPTASKHWGMTEFFEVWRGFFSGTRQALKIHLRELLRASLAGTVNMKSRCCILTIPLRKIQKIATYAMKSFLLLQGKGFIPWHTAYSPNVCNFLRTWIKPALWGHCFWDSFSVPGLETANCHHTVMVGQEHCHGSSC